MRELFPVIQPGQMPTRQHFNRVSKVCGRVANIKGMGFGKQGNSFINFAQLPRGAMFVFEITDEQIDSSESSANDDDKYLGKIIWYSHDTKEWKDTEDKEWLIDADGFSDVAFSVGDRIVCFWDGQRGAFIPTMVGTGNVKWGKLDADLLSGSTATVSIWEGGPRVSDLSDSGKNVTAGAPPLLTTGTLSSGDWVLVQKIGGYWWVTGAEC